MNKKLIFVCAGVMIFAGLVGCSSDNSGTTSGTDAGAGTTASTNSGTGSGSTGSQTLHVLRQQRCRAALRSLVCESV